MNELGMPDSEDGERGEVSLPSRIVVVSRSPELAAALAVEFDAVRIITPDEVPEKLPADPAGAECVGLIGLADHRDDLGRLVRELLEARRDRFMLVFAPSELSAPRAGELTEAFTGFRVVGVSTVSGKRCIVFRRAEGDHVPDLFEAVSTLVRAGGSVGDAVPNEAVPAHARNQLLQRQLDRLQEERDDARAALHNARESGGEAGRAYAELAAEVARLRRSRLVRLAASVSNRGNGERNGGRTRRLFAAGLIGLFILAGVSALVGLVANSHAGTAIATAVLLICLPSFAYLVRGIRHVGRSTGRSRRAVNRLAAALRRFEKDASSRSRTVEQRLRDHAASLTKLEHRSGVMAVTLVDTANTVAELRQDSHEQLQALAERHASGVHQTQALINLFTMLPVRSAVPLMGGWAASPDVTLLLVDEVLRRKPRLIVECGSGVSTLWMALAIDRFGLPSRIVSLEHEPGFGRQTRELLERHGVGHVADVRDAPLIPAGLDGHDTPWYARSQTEDLEDIGLLFVDGPPETTGALARYPAIPVLSRHFAQEVTVVLDDLIRQSERDVTKLWQEQLPDFDLERVPLEKWAAVFRRT